MGSEAIVLAGAVFAGFAFLALAILFLVFHREILPKRPPLHPSGSLYTTHRAVFLDNSPTEPVRFGRYGKAEGAWLGHINPRREPDFYAQAPHDRFPLGWSREHRAFLWLFRLDRQGFPLESEQAFQERVQRLSPGTPSWRPREEAFLEERARAVSAHDEALLYQAGELEESRRMDMERAESAYKDFVEETATETPRSKKKEEEGEE